MPDVWLITERSPTASTHQLVQAMQQAIGDAIDTMQLMTGEPSNRSTVSPDCRLSELRTNVVSVTDLSRDWQPHSNDLVCPLTLQLPVWLQFPGQEVFRLCENVAALREKLASRLYLTGNGNYWLPIALTRKGPLYAEVIGVRSATGSFVEADTESHFVQPIHLADQDRQAIYQMGQQLLSALAAPPSLYLLQFGWQGKQPCFDRLLPFPAEPAIASIGTQTPDLFTCHWYCLTDQPLHDLTISS